MWFKYIYIVFVISSILLGNYHIGPFTPKIYSALLVFAVCLKNSKLYFDKYLFLYSIFVISFLVSGYVLGYGERSIIYFLSYYFVCYVAYVSTRYYLERYGMFDDVFKFLLYLGIIDAIVTIAQMLGYSFAFNLSDTLADKEQSDRLYNYVGNYGNLMGKALPGLFTAVQNGYFLSAASILAFWANKNTNLAKQIAIWILMIIALFCVQERTGFFVGLSLSLFVLWKRLRETKMNSKILLVFIALVAFIAFRDSLSEMFFSENSRFNNLDFSENQRIAIFAEALYFIKENLLFGSIFYYMDIYEMPPHNVFLNAFVYGGIFGGIAIIILLFLQLPIIKNILIRSSISKNQDIFISCLIYIAYTANSLTHNLSIVSGGAIFFVMWSVITSLYQQRRR